VHKLNASKSGILEIVHPRSKLSLPLGSNIDQIPVVDSYKYLGLEIDHKLNGDLHILKLKKRIQFLTLKLAPLLAKISLDYKINLWKTLLRPLFNPMLAIMAHNNKGRVKALERLLKGSFKRFVGLSISTQDNILRKLINFDIFGLAKKQERIALSKWHQRLRFVPSIHAPKEEKVKTPLLPKIFASYNNIQKQKCQLCAGTCLSTADHLQKTHGLPIPTTLSLLEELERDFPRKKSQPRNAILKLREKRIQLYFHLILRYVN
jgi:hypothetical protein